MMMAMQGIADHPNDIAVDNDDITSQVQALLLHRSSPAPSCRLRAPPLTSYPR